MKTRQARWTPEHGWTPTLSDGDQSADLVLVFGDREALEDANRRREIRAAFPNAIITGCSTAGEIQGPRVYDGSLVVTAIQFRSSSSELVQVPIDRFPSGVEAGVALAEALPSENLNHVFVLSDGVNVNGSELVQGLRDSLPNHVMATGGLSGDGADFGRTTVLYGDQAMERTVLALGLYGDNLRVGHGCLGGWDPFGPERKVTKSQGNVLYELDGHSALETYKRYLGEYADQLPSSALLFPLSLRMDNESGPVVRTILGISEEESSMTFAGDIPQGSVARFMKANFDRLIDGATEAARSSYERIGSAMPDLAILISCVGRKIVLDQRVEEEVESVQDVLGDDVTLTGFYSYGEISPLTPGAGCALHNQTMTITTLSER